MELDHLIEFEHTARLGNLSRAAEELNISISALSKHISALEKNVGAELFKRMPRGVVLTGAGERLLSCTKPVKEIRAGILKAAEEARGQDVVTVNILSVPILAHYEISSLIASFSRLNPGMEISVSENYRAVACFLSGEYELAVTRKLPEMEDVVEYLPICDDWLVLLVPEGHRLSGEDAVDITELRGEPLIVNNAHIRSILTERAAEAGFQPHYKNLARDGVSNDTLFELVRLGAGLTVTMSQIAEHSAMPGLKILELTPRHERNMYLARMRGKKLSPGAAAFWKHIKEHAPAT